MNILTFVRRTDQRRNGHVVSLWRCACGNEREIADYVVKLGRAKSCGCLKTKHGLAKERPPEYAAWMSMNNRCNSPTASSADRYHHRGITVCDRWKDFRAFLEDMGPRPTERHSVGRINNDLGYFPDNCRWETPDQQCVNQERSRYWHIKGLVFDSSAQAARHFGVHMSTISYWVKTGKAGCYAVRKY